ncbi:MAG: hypothetical protein H6Q67_284 [Firmicutes bacterium]|nr:hypothetical protein [Bacillota bacterium]
MNARDTMFKTVKCKRFNNYTMVQDTITTLGNNTSHTFRCREFTKCNACFDCQYHNPLTDAP